jgi:hypothetical protein
VQVVYLPGLQIYLGLEGPNIMTCSIRPPCPFGPPTEQLRDARQVRSSRARARHARRCDQVGHYAFLRKYFPRRHANHTHGVVVDLSFLASLLLLHLFLAQIERVVRARGYWVRHGSLRGHEEGEWVAERRGERIRCAVEGRAWAAAGNLGHIEGLGAPVGTTGERGVVLKVGGDKACGPVVAEAGEQVRISSSLVSS